MSFEVQSFDHDSPSAPTRTLGMQLGVSGVSIPSLQTLGSLTATGSGSADFNDTNGYGQFAYDSAGRMYIADTVNNRIKRYVCTSGVWETTPSTIQTGITTLLGGGSNPCIVAIDRTVTPNQIHVAAFDQAVDNTWINVWSVSDFGSFSTGNRLRRYGSNTTGSATAGKARFGSNLQLDGTHAIVSGASSSGRLLSWNHQTGALVADIALTPGLSQMATDGAGSWWASGDADNLLKKYDPTTLSVTATLSAVTNNQWRQNRTFSSGGGTVAYHNGLLLLRDVWGRLQGYDASGGTYKDTYGDPGSLESSTFTGKHGVYQIGATPYRNKIGVVVDGDSCAWLVGWNWNGNTTSSSSFVTLQPISVATATWTKTDWSEGTNTLTAIALDGTNLSAEKFKIRLRKNAGSYVTVLANQLTGSAFTSAISGLGTFTDGDTLTFELSLSTNERQDGHASLFAVRDKLSPANVKAELYYTDTAATVYTPTATASFKAKVGATGAYKARIQG